MATDIDSARRIKPAHSPTARGGAKPSPLLQLLREAPRYTLDSNHNYHTHQQHHEHDDEEEDKDEDDGDDDGRSHCRTTSANALLGFPRSKIARKLSAVGTVRGRNGGAGSGGGGAGGKRGRTGTEIDLIPRERPKPHLGALVSAPINPPLSPYTSASAQVNLIPPKPSNPLLSRISSSSVTLPTSSAFIKSISPSFPSTFLGGSNLHLPTVKRPNLSTELRRRVLLNTSTSLEEYERQKQQKQVAQVQVQHRVQSPAPALGGTRVRASSRSGLRTRGGRVGVGMSRGLPRGAGRGHRRGPLSVKEIETGDVTRVAKSMCTTEDETVVKEKVLRFLRKQERERVREQERERERGRQRNRAELQMDVCLQEDKQKLPPLPSPPLKTTTHGTDTNATGTATRNLRKLFTSQKISHKKEVLERAFGWHSRIFDDGHFDEHEGEDDAAVRGPRPHEETTPVPMGQSVSGSGSASERFVGAVKIPGSTGSSGKVTLAQSSVGGGGGGEWVDEEGEGVYGDTVIMGDGTVRKGRRGHFHLDQSRIPPTPVSKPTRQSQEQHTVSSPPGSHSSSNPHPNPRTRRSFQRFDRVEDWLDHQNHHPDGEDPDINPLSTPARILHPPNPELVSVYHTPATHLPVTPKPLITTSRPFHTPSAALYERKYPLNLAHLPYLKHTLRSKSSSASDGNMNQRGGRKGGGVVTISPPTDSDPLGYIHLDLKAKRYVYTIIPGSGRLNEVGGCGGRYTVVIVHPRRHRYSSKEKDYYFDEKNDGLRLEENDDDNDEAKKYMPPKEQVYELSSLPVKHLSVVKFASKFVGIVRRETVVVRIEGQQARPGHTSYSPDHDNHHRHSSSVEAQSQNPKWEWYRGEIYADGRFEFTTIPRGAVLASSDPGLGGGETRNADADKTIALVAGVVKLVFTKGSSIPVSRTVDAAATTKKDPVPRFISGSSNSKLRKVHVEITRTHAQEDGSAAEAGSLLSSFPSLPKVKVVLWSGMVELGAGSAPTSLIAPSGTTAHTSDGGDGNAQAKYHGLTAPANACAGFAAEVDWARRLWIECKRLLDKGR